MSRSSRPSVRAAAIALLAVSLSACEDRNIRQLTVGIPRDSVLRILALESASSDSTPNVYREERYLHNGRWITILMYTNTGSKEGMESVDEADLVPVLLRDDTLTGWGWTHHDSVARANNIVIKPRDK
jgi:hypothetical protein